ncbi:MAG: LuxR C-terminal-related transcriptional regulator [Deltaproteobacteria bacterium]|nr:LuxR C-terminal-related transcriptional regulator [Deltaproteobacteria bacterium]
MDNSPTGRGSDPDMLRGWVPHWVDLLGMPVWVTGADGNVAFINSRAEELLGKPAQSCLGHPCYEAVGGLSLDGSPFCTPNCPVHRLAAGGREIEPYPLRIPKSGKRDEILRVVVIVSRPPGQDGGSFVHCIVDDARHERFKNYLDKVVARSRKPAELSLDAFALTRREREVLRLLAEDESLHSIAHRFNLSYATVRNHSQHILKKLRVHSILEAIALYLLIED